MRAGTVILIGVLCIFPGTVPCRAQCPSMDATGDCFVNLDDLAVFARQWLTGDGIPGDLAAIPAGSFSMGDALGDGSSNEHPVHTAILDGFIMSRYEITNGQYCEFLNDTPLKLIDGAVYGQTDTSNSYPYFSTTSASTFSQISLKFRVSGVVFVVNLKGRSDMSQDPVVEVSWYGAEGMGRRPKGEANSGRRPETLGRRGE
jgi:formylglycine-generating enzyme required for sulfatase activity